ncbi:MAG: 4-(cytidine 5'-diphospho)-2-C-methyl-D-erythritol kinase [Bacteroidales bacterium]|nr:4-(cytidine 5'-diphospho)-2-C-methyl-D-erythritol kinase [Bacteroidales bacterium]
MLCFPFAKINLGLAVLNKRSDGFHSIESLLYPIQMYDILEIIEDKTSRVDEFSVSGLALDIAREDNLVWKALLFMRRHFDFPALKIHLHKQIPSASGLGGGSSDAAFTLKAINQLFQFAVDESTLKTYAAELGSDCPFFIHSFAQYARGRGELLEPFELKISSLKLLLIIPDFSVSTQEAYAKIKSNKKQTSPKEILNQPIENWKKHLKNDFEAVVFNDFPSLGAWKKELYRKGAIFVSLSGSGSAMFALFEKQIDLKPAGNYRFYWMNFPN